MHEAISTVHNTLSDWKYIILYIQNGFVILSLLFFYLLQYGAYYLLQEIKSGLACYHG